MSGSGGNGHRQLMPGCFDERAARLDRAADDGCQFNGFLPQLDLAPRNPGNFHQIVHQANHVVDLAFHHLADAFGGRIVTGGQAENVQGISDRGQRVAQFVGQNSEEFVLPAIGVAGRFFEAMMRLVSKYTPTQPSTRPAESWVGL